MNHIQILGYQRPTKPSDESWIKNADSAGMWLMCGSYMSVDYVIETLIQATVHGESYAELKKKYTPPLMPDYGDPGWFQSFELGHQGYSEFLIYWDQDEDTTGVDYFYIESAKMNIKERFYPALIGPHQPLYLTGPKFGPNYHEWLLKVKEEFDPRWLSHPPVPLAHDVFVERAQWMKPIKDWKSPKKIMKKQGTLICVPYKVQGSKISPRTPLTLKQTGVVTLTKKLFLFISGRRIAALKEGFYNG